MPSSLLIHSSARVFSLRFAVCRSRGGIYVTLPSFLGQRPRCTPVVLREVPVFMPLGVGELLTSVGQSPRLRTSSNSSGSSFSNVCHRLLTASSSSWRFLRAASSFQALYPCLACTGGGSTLALTSGGGTVFFVGCFSAGRAFCLCTPRIVASPGIDVAEYSKASPGIDVRPRLFLARGCPLFGHSGRTCPRRWQW